MAPTVTPDTPADNSIEERLVRTAKLISGEIVQVAGRSMAAAGLTFGDFVRACRSLGVADSDPLDSIEYGIAQMGSGVIAVERPSGIGVEIREVR